MRPIARLWLLGALVAAMALGPGVAWATGLTSSVGTLAEDALGQNGPPSAGSLGDEDDDEDDDEDGDDDGDDDDGDDDDDDGGGGDRAFCGSVVQPSTPVVRSTKAVRVNRKRVAAVRVTGAANEDSTVTVKLRRKRKLLGSKSVGLDAGESRLVKVKLSRKAFALLKLRDRRQVKAIVTAEGAAGPPGFGQCSIPARLDFDFDASSGPLGENPTGTFFFESLPLRFEGQVTCLQVTGNRASVGGIVTAAHNAVFVGRGFAFTVLDNTPVAPDLISFPTVLDQLLLPAAPGANTPNCGSVFEPTRQVTGDFVVQDNLGGGGDDEDDDDDHGDDDDDGDDDD